MYKIKSFILAVLVSSMITGPVPVFSASTGAQIDFLMNQVRYASGSLAGGKVYFYATGGSTLKAVYLDINKSSQAANPYTLDANGTAMLYGDGTYRIVIKTAALVTVYDRDPVKLEDLYTDLYNDSYNQTIKPLNITGNDNGRIQGYKFGSASYTDNGYFNDLIVKGPWVDVRAFLPVGYVTDGSVNYSTQLVSAVNYVASGGTVIIPIPIGIGSNGWTGIALTGLDNITIRGEGAGRIKLLFIPSQTFPLYSTYVSLMISNSRNVTIKGLDFDGNSIKSTLLGLDNVMDSSVTFNKFHNSEFSDVARPLMATLYGNRNTITNNNFKGGCYQLVVGIGNINAIENGAIVSLNTFENPRGCIGATAYNSVISNNIFNRCDAAINLGFGPVPSHDIVVAANVARNCTDFTGYGGVAYTTDGTWDNTDSQLMYNISYIGNFSDNCGTGIRPSYLRDSIVSGNIITRVNDGIGIGVAKRLVVSGNKVSGQWSAAGSYGGIVTSSVNLVGDLEDIIITGNVITGFTASGTSGIRTTGGTKRLSITGNILSNNYRGIYLFPYDNIVNVSNNIIDNTTSYNMDLYAGIKSLYGINNITTGPNLQQGVTLKYNANGRSQSVGAAAPTDNTVPCVVGDIVWNTALDNVIGWKCTSAGSPGTWGSMTVTMP